MILDVIDAGYETRPSSWLVVTQERVDAFAEVTEDRQAIHVDPELAVAGPFGTTVAHGFLTLSLIVHFWYEVAPSSDGRVSLNYGLDRVRFPAPVPVGSRIRGRFRVDRVDEVDGGVQLAVAATVEREGNDKPVCVAEMLIRVLS